MSDVQPIQGAPIPPEAKSAEVNTSKFKEEAKKAQQQVGKIDPDNTKKKKQQGAKDDDSSQQSLTEAAIPLPVPPSASIYDVQAGTSPVHRAGLGAGAPPPSSSTNYLPPVTEPDTSPSNENPVDSPPVDETPVDEFPPEMDMENSLFDSETDPTQTEQPFQSKTPPSTQTPQKTTTPSTPKNTDKKEAPTQKTAQAPKLVKTSKAELKPQLAPLAKPVVKALEQAPPPKEAELPEDEAKTPVTQETVKTTNPLQPTKEGMPVPIKKTETQEKKVQAIATEEASTNLDTPNMAPPSPLELQNAVAPPPPPSPSAYLSPSIQALYEKMVGLIVASKAMSDEGEVKTVEITLNADENAGSKFFNTKIILKEFSSAPGAYNIELEGTDEQVSILKKNSPNLLAAFAAGKYNFKINRIDISLKSADKAEDKKLFQRKGSVGDNAAGDKQQKG